MSKSNKRNKAKQASLNMARAARIPDSGGTIASQIAKGLLTRERSCDGKARFTTYDYADRVGRENGPSLGKTFNVYACPFCSGYHLATASVTGAAS